MVARRAEAAVDQGGRRGVHLQFYGSITAQAASCLPELKSEATYRPQTVWTVTDAAWPALVPAWLTYVRTQRMQQLQVPVHMSGVWPGGAAITDVPKGPFGLGT